MKDIQDMKDLENLEDIKDKKGFEGQFESGRNLERGWNRGCG